MNKAIALIASAIIGFGATSFASDSTSIQSHKKTDILNHLDVGLTVGTTGIGCDFSLPITDYVKVRTGMAYMPKFNVPMHFNIMNYTSDGMSAGSFDKARDLLNTIAGFETHEDVIINGEPNMLSFKLLFDVFPFRDNKHWHFTAGFHISGSKVGSALNDIREMQTLVSVQLYNNMYDYFTQEKYIDSPLYNDYYIDPEVGDQLRDKFNSYGRLGVRLGTFKDTGKPYIMEPGKDGTMRAEALVNKFRPYLGFGYGGFLDKAKKWNVSFDCGVLFWGGHPRIVTHDGVDLTRDVENISGKVGNYVKTAKALKAYPVLNFRIYYSVF